jgi:glycosyltransferase involved in cell wall biosynthesis
MISIDYGQSEGEVLNGVRLLKMHKPDAGLPGFRFVHPRVTSVWAAMRRADADVYYQRASGVHTGLVAAFARRYQRVSVFAATHDHDFRPDPPSLRLRRDRMIFSWGIRRVTRVVTQTERQQALCSEVFGRESVHIDSAYGHRGEPAAHSGVVLWVANAKRHKRPHLFLELAARLPQYRFRLVGGPADQAEERRYFEELQARAKVLPNVEMTGYVPYAEIESMFDGAAVFVNSSVGEGFPNTFMQAWSRGIPTVSFFDPQTRLDGDAVGIVVDSVDQMADTVRWLKEDAASWSIAGERSRRAFAQTHSLARVVTLYERLIDDAVSSAALSAS